MTEQNDKNLDRRRFLARAGKAGISIAAAGLISYQLYDRYGPTTGVDAESLVTLPDFRVPDKPGQTMSIVKGPDRKATVNKAIELLGGIERFADAWSYSPSRTRGRGGAAVLQSRCKTGHRYRQPNQ